jgi:hypothetical protein
MVGRIGLVVCDVNYRDQRQAEVLDFVEQSIQRGLVDDLAMDDGGAVGLVREGQPVKPGGPPGIEVPFDADFASSCLVPIASRRVRFAHHRVLLRMLIWMISAGIANVSLV